ncbi:uncharacterized protein N7459_005703 [Penicillium hispanicum]|uniref:uncharacterized protein n=1 Tax=Penicillium hispanicum TaxID=1080232 RepID=UPI0025418990|nr:uncharacterized protein N7459_005703 [Penicillium hispanicum]KAJ5579718.1 hypothetical protein N7459_005703 [Penicillium hispanicum]
MSPPSRDTPGVTKEYCSWVHNLSLNDIPEHVRTRAKYLILDGICCGLVGAHLPWTEKAANGIFAIEPEGDCVVWGYERKLGALPAALLNGTEIQSFELDDWHIHAPLHSNSVVLPALLAAASQKKAQRASTFDGASFLLATIVGYETGPRIGQCLYGGHMLSRGWHSGTVFGHAASAAAVSKLLQVPENVIEDALGMACTQACGLMSAQFGSDVKRMQHGFAARNGLFAALMAESGYIGIKNVIEEPYGGFLAAFGANSGKEPPFLPQELTKELNQTWQCDDIRVKSHASMAGTHCTADAIAALQKEFPKKFSNVEDIVSIKLEMSEAAFKHGGWKAQRPLTATGAQMSCSYVAAVQLVDRLVSPQEFRHELLDRDVLWGLVDKTECFHTPELGEKYEQRVTIAFKDGSEAVKTLAAPRDVAPGLSNEEILDKFRTFTGGIIEEQRRDAIEKLVLNLETVADIAGLEALLAGQTKNPIA